MTLHRSRHALLVAAAALLAHLAAPAAFADEAPSPPPAPLADPAEDAPLAPPPTIDPAAASEDAPPPAPPASKTSQPSPKKALPAADAKPADDGMLSTLGWGTVGGGAVAAVAVGGLALLSPCGCAMPAACAVTTCGFAGGAIVGHELEDRAWSARSLLPAGAATGIGVAVGAATTVAVVLTPLIVDAAMPDPGADPDAARLAVLTSSGVTALAGAATVLVGSLVAGVAATALERAGDQAPAKKARAKAPPNTASPDGADAAPPSDGRRFTY
ncbi:MAG: hypothetical protein HYS27_28530 [Deltaproteobacteria bacterium]|nr:hypothetical protein [Deltaproteobacteria bacterium]